MLVLSHDRVLAAASTSYEPDAIDRAAETASISFIAKTAEQGKGLGRVLLDAAMAAAKQDGCISAEQTVYNDNDLHKARVERRPDWVNVSETEDTTTYRKPM